MRPIDADALMEYCNNLKNKTIDANDIARFPTAYGWINVKDRLPDVKDNVLWYAVMNGGYGEIRISSFSGAIKHDIPQVWGYGESFKPIYWMPLPEPPKVGEDE